MGQVRYTGWAVDRGCRDRLLARLKPRYRRVVADHVTLEGRVPPDAPKPPPAEGRIVGQADDGRGVQAMVVELNGKTDRPDGSTFHITWSLEPGRRAVESNDVIAAGGWTPIEPPIPVELIPGRYPN